MQVVGHGSGGGEAPDRGQLKGLFSHPPSLAVCAWAPGKAPLSSCGFSVKGQGGPKRGSEQTPNEHVWASSSRQGVAW